MELTELIKHPERMDKETLYDLRSSIALYPYYQSARLLMLQNLYILHDPSFDEELRRAAIFITDRRVIFNMVEAAHYRLRTKPRQHEEKKKPGESRTVTFPIVPDDLTMFDREGHLVVEPGEFRVMIGASYDDIRLRTSFFVGTDDHRRAAEGNQSSKMMNDPDAQ